MLFILSVSSDLSSAVYNLFPQKSQKQDLVLLIAAGFSMMAKKHPELSVDSYTHLFLQTIRFALYLHLSRGKCCHKSLFRRQNVLGDHFETVRLISWDIRRVTNLTFHSKCETHLCDLLYQKHWGNIKLYNQTSSIKRWHFTALSCSLGKKMKEQTACNNQEVVVLLNVFWNDSLMPR